MSNIKYGKALLFISLFISVATPAVATGLPDVQQLFKQKCSLCHGLEKKKFGPAIKAMSREGEVLREVIAKGKKSMPGYEGKLSGAEIDALVDYLLKNQ